MYAEFLFSDKKAYEDAAIVYQRLRLFDRALECCLKVKKFEHFHYKNCVGYLNKIAGNVTQQQLSKYQNGLLDKLVYSSNFNDAVEFVDLHMNVYTPCMNVYE